MSELVSLFFSILGAYPLFWLQSFDSKYRVCVYRKKDLDSENTFVIDERPAFFSTGAAIWAIAFGILYSYSQGRCSFEKYGSVGYHFAFGVVSIAVTAKILFGAAAVNHKRLLLSGHNILVRPSSWRIIDVLTPIPVNLTAVPLTKLIWFPILGAVAWVFNGFSVVDSQLIIPIYVFAAAFFLVLARLANMYIERDEQPFKMSMGLAADNHYRDFALLVVALICLMSFFLTTTQLEKILSNCGASAGRLPSYSILLTGLSSMPVLAIVGAILTSFGIKLVSLVRN